MKPSLPSLRATLRVTGICALILTGCGQRSTASGEVFLEEMNRALSLMSMSPAGPPRTVAELTNFPAFKGRPFSTPPAGKKFTISRATGQIVVVDP